MTNKLIMLFDWTIDENQYDLSSRINMCKTITGINQKSKYCECFSLKPSFNEIIHHKLCKCYLCTKFLNEIKNKACDYYRDNKIISKQKSCPKKRRPIDNNCNDENYKIILYIFSYQKVMYLYLP